MSGTDRVRVTMVALFALTVLAALLGWLLGRDVSVLEPVLMWAAAGVGAGEASNVGKRATFRREATDAETN